MVEVGGGVVVVVGDEVAAACWTLKRSHEESKSAAMAWSDLYESASSWHESVSSWHESNISLHESVSSWHESLASTTALVKSMAKTNGAIFGEFF